MKPRIAALLWSSGLSLFLAAGCGTPQADSPNDAASAEDGFAADALDAASDVTTATVNVHLQPGFLNIAHRGGGKLAPEETRVAYQNAIQVGADVIECDAHSTSDGIVVCIHDETVDRTTDGKGSISGMTFAQLRALDAGYAYSPDGGVTFPYRGKALQVASLDEFLQIDPVIGLSIEIKQADPPIEMQVVQAIVASGALDRTVLISFNDDTMAQVRTLEPRLTTGLALGEMLAFSTMEDADEAHYVPPARVIQAPTNQMAPKLLVARAHRLGMKVQFWTINDAKQMSELVALGADGIFTDDPAKLHDVVSPH